MLAPLFVTKVPLDCFAQALVEAMRLFPTELLLDPRAVDGVAPIVARPILNVGDRRANPIGIEMSLLGDELDEAPEKLHVLPLVLPADIVAPAGFAALHDLPDSGVMVLDVDPVADVLAVAVDRKALSLQHVEDHKWNKLLGELIGPVVVRAVGQGHR